MNYGSPPTEYRYTCRYLSSGGSQNFRNVRPLRYSQCTGKSELQCRCITVIVHEFMILRKQHTLKAEVVSVTDGGFTVAMSCVAAATMRPTASSTLVLFRIPSGVNSDSCTGSLSEGKGFPSLSQMSTMLSTEEDMISRRALRSLVML